ncbi:MAG: PDZ domain-containing protein [Calditrichaeota bacterium]|nr:MAG: PDZ domain-containing protein [Calditrichota bacterium]
MGRLHRHRVRFRSNRFSILVGRPRLGAEVHELNADLAAYFHVEENGGALITDVFEDSPAEDAGLKAGDVIVKVDDEEISDPDDLTDTLEEYEEGDVVTVEFVRNGKKQKVEVELEEMNAYGFRFWNPERDGSRFFLFDKFMSHGPRMRIRAPKVHTGATLI